MALIRPSTFFRHVSSPRGVIDDFITVFHQAGSNRWRIALLAAIATTAIFSVMFQEGARGKPRPPVVDYITVWDPHRTEAEIIASNIANQKRKDRLAAEQAKREEEVRNIYKSLGRATGMDVDAIEKKALADKAAEDRAKAGPASTKATAPGE